MWLDISRTGTIVVGDTDGGQKLKGGLQKGGETYIGFSTRGQPNPNNSAESEYIRNRIVPFLIDRIGNKTIRIRFL